MDSSSVLYLFVFYSALPDFELIYCGVFDDVHLPLQQICVRMNVYIYLFIYIYIPHQCIYIY
jgi:hypothetical protein